MVPGRLTLLCPQVWIPQRLHVHPKPAPVTASGRAVLPRGILLAELHGDLRHVGHGPIAKVARQRGDFLRVSPLDQIGRLVGPLGAFSRDIAPVLPRPARVGGWASSAGDAGCGYASASASASSCGQGRTDLTRRADGLRRLLLVLVPLLAQGDAL